MLQFRLEIGWRHLVEVEDRQDVADRSAERERGIASREQIEGAAGASSSLAERNVRGLGHAMRSEYNEQG